jgi:uncharacterized membrane protein YccC
VTSPRHVNVPTDDRPTTIGLVRSRATSPAANSTARPVLVHSLRTAAVTVTSLMIALLFGLPEAYWAAITTLVIEQSSLGAARTVSRHRFIGTLLGAAVGAIVATLPVPRAVAFGASVFLLGPLRVLSRSDLNGYRFGVATLAIILLVPRVGPAWLVALHRFIEVSIGIAVALVLAVAWPEKEPAAG